MSWKTLADRAVRGICPLAMLALLAGALVADETVWQTAVSQADAPIIFRTVLVEDEVEEPAAAGAAAARQLLAALGDAPLQAVLVSECFEDLDYKEELLRGIGAVIPAERIYGTSTYGSFTHQGTGGFDTVSLLGIAGNGIAVSAALVTEMGTSRLAFEEDEPLIKERLHVAGKQLAEKLPRTDQDRLLILLADAHSPKNQYLVEGVQKVVGDDFAITGGSANRNAGQTFVYFQNQAYEDGAVALMLSGDFQLVLSGRKAMEEDEVISSARDGMQEALEGLEVSPLSVLAFNCAGRRGRLQRPVEELNAIREVLSADIPLFGLYCAGEVGPLDPTEAKPGVRCGGSGWHVMFTVIGR